MEEVDAWRANSELNFIDFDLLNEDIVKYKKSPDSVDREVLFRALVYLKAIHEFTEGITNFIELNANLLKVIGRDMKLCTKRSTAHILLCLVRHQRMISDLSPISMVTIKSSPGRRAEDMRHMRILL